MHKRIEDFLDRATEGLRDDDELRRETRAELATHAEEKLGELTDAGKAEDDAVEETLKAMGEVVDVVGELQQANRGRMRLRAQARLLLRFALVPAAVVVALMSWNIPSLATREAFGGIGESKTIGNIVPPVGTLRERLFDSGPTPEQDLVLHGDLQREDEAARQRAIWESNPTNLVFLGNYVSALAASTAWTTGETEFVRSELGAARATEPDNARFDLMEAAVLLSAAIDLVRETSPQENMARPAEEPERYVLTIHDRAMLDETMALVKAGLGKPYYRRYSGDMLMTRMKIHGPPRRFTDFIHQTALAVSVILPDLQHVMNLARTSVAYGELLLVEGRPEDAAAYLEAPFALGRYVTEDSFVLIDTLVARGLFDIAAEQGARVYRESGLGDEAVRLAAKAEAAARPVEAWRSRLTAGRAHRGRGEEILEARGSVMVSVLLPALGEWPDQTAYEASRRAEYAVIAESLLSAISFDFVLAMLCCLVVALRWRLFSPRGASIPILLLPGIRRTTWTVVLGVLLPIAVFLVVTRGLTWSGHSYSVRYGAHKLIAEFTLLAVALAAVPVVLTLRAVKERCRQLDLSITPFIARHFLWGAAVGCVVLGALWFVPAMHAPGVMTVSALAAGVVGASLGLCALAAWLQGLAGRKDRGLYYGTLFRSLIPVLASVVIVLGLFVQPFIVRSEAAYLARDTLMLNPDGPGFTKVETDLTERLKSETLAALGALDAVDSAP